MKYELTAYLLIAAIAFVYRTVLSGRKNGCFYHKNDKVLPPMLKASIENIHGIESPAWYAQSIGVGVLVLALNRALNYSMDIWIIAQQIGISILFVIGLLQAASYHFQRGITAGLKSDTELDSVTKSEVVIRWLGISFWKPRLFSNKGRIVAQWLGIIEILVAIGLIIYLN